MCVVFADTATQTTESSFQQVEKEEDEPNFEVDFEGDHDDERNDPTYVPPESTSRRLSEKTIKV